MSIEHDLSVLRSFFYEMYPILAKEEEEVRGMGLEEALEVFEHGYATGMFSVLEDDVYWLDPATEKYEIITELKKEYIETLEYEREG